MMYHTELLMFYLFNFLPFYLYQRQSVLSPGGVRGVPTAGLNQVCDVKGAAEAEQRRRERVAGVQLGVDGLLHGETSAAIVAHKTVTVRLPAKFNAVADGKARRRDLPVRKKLRVCSARLADSLTEGSPVPIARETGEDGERTLAQTAVISHISPQAFYRSDAHVHAGVMLYSPDEVGKVGRRNQPFAYFSLNGRLQAFYFRVKFFHTF